MAVFSPLLLAVACQPAMRTAPTLPQDDASFLAQEVPPKPGMEDVADDAPDTLRPGDVLSLRVIGAKDLDQAAIPVDRTGHVHLPLIGDVVVGGKTLSGAEKDIQTALEKYDKFSKAALSLVDSKARVATVTGAVEHPGNVPLVGDPHLADVLAAAGGPKITTQEDRIVQLGDVDGARIMRAGVALPVDARRALEGDPRHNVRVKPGDVIVVPPALQGRIVILGHVNRPRSLQYRQGLRLTEALAEAGGLLKSADSEDVRILRGGYAKPKMFVANAKDLLAGRRSDVILAPGDVVYITEHWFASVGDVLEKAIPIAAAGVLLNSAK